MIPRRRSQEICLSFLFVAMFFAASVLAEDGQEYNQENTDDDRFAFVSDVADRIEEDATGMWYSSPSQWITEYWEVFGGTLLVLFLLLLCNCWCCCCTGSGSDTQTKQTIVATPDELTEQQRHDLEQPILMETPKSLDPVLDATSVTDATMTDISKTSSTKRRPRSTVLGEVVSVWSEFLGFSPEEEQSYYKTMSGNASSKSKRKKKKKQQQRVAELPTVG